MIILLRLTSLLRCNLKVLELMFLKVTQISNRVLSLIKIETKLKEVDSSNQI